MNVVFLLNPEGLQPLCELISEGNSSRKMSTVTSDLPEVTLIIDLKGAVQPLAGDHISYNPKRGKVGPDPEFQN